MAKYEYLLTTISNKNIEIEVWEVVNGNSVSIFSESGFSNNDEAIATALTELKGDYPDVVNMTPVSAKTSSTSGTSGGALNTLGVNTVSTTTTPDTTAPLKQEITKERYDEIKKQELAESNLDVYEEVDTQEDADDLITSAEYNFVDEEVIMDQDTDSAAYAYDPNSNYVFKAPDNSLYIDKSAPLSNTTNTGGKAYTGSGVSVSCTDIVNNWNKNLKISKHYTLGEVAVYFDRLQDKQVMCKRNGTKVAVNFTKYQLACNLKSLAVNVLDKIKDQFPDMTLNSTIRNIGTGSEHETGQAADMKFPTHKKKDYVNIANWIKQNCPFNQLFLEYRPTENPRGGWVHVSYADSKNQIFGASKTYGSLYNDDGKRAPGALGSLPNIMSNSDWT